MSTVFNVPAGLDETNTISSSDVSADGLAFEPFALLLVVFLEVVVVVVAVVRVVVVVEVFFFPDAPFMFFAFPVSKKYLSVLIFWS